MSTTPNHNKLLTISCKHQHHHYAMIIQELFCMKMNLVSSRQSRISCKHQHRQYAMMIRDLLYIKMKLGRPSNPPNNKSKASKDRNRACQRSSLGSITLEYIVSFTIYDLLIGHSRHWSCNNNNSIFGKTIYIITHYWRFIINRKQLEED